RSTRPSWFVPSAPTLRRSTSFIHVPSSILQRMTGSDEFYDSLNVHETYLKQRQRPDNPNDAIEGPHFLRLAGDMHGLDIIDLGCGDGQFGREALERGANSYQGIDASERMAALARYNLEGLEGRVAHQTIEEWRATPSNADLVTSRLALNYVEDVASVLRQAHDALRPNGRVVLSVEHPIITSSFASLAHGRRMNWLVDDYFRPGARPHTWMGQEVVKYHHTLEDWLELVKDSGLHLERLCESRPSRENFQSEQEYERRLRIPLFLVIAARKLPVAHNL